jgi:tetratricopeptide (TPR) repeat protein
VSERTHTPRWIASAGCALALAAGVIAIWGQTLSYDFVTFDDDQYVTDNPSVREGLSWAGVAYAFSKGRYQEGHPPHPLTWLSHMLDVELFGLDAGGHHATNFALHAASAVLLFAALQALTGATWRSAAAAALWAWHPLRVESVAWVSERKDVLSGVFAMLTLLGYARYAGSGSRAAWAWTHVAFALGLASKSTLVPLPFALLLLDHWPLARQAPLARLVREKSGLFALSALSSLLTLEFHRGWMLSTEAVPPLARVVNAALAVPRYLGKLLWPQGLAPFYPHPYLPAEGGVPPTPLAIAAAALLGIAITLAVLRERRRLPYLAVGWLWFLGMLVPTIGLVHVGLHAIADRYTYLPAIGFCVAVVWGISEGIARARPPALRSALAAAAALALAGYAAASFAQTRSWRDSETLYRHALAAEPRAIAMRINLGSWLVSRGRLDEAVEEFQAAVAAAPDNPLCHFDLGRTLHVQGRVAEAAAAYRAGLALQPGHPSIHFELGRVLHAQGRVAEAIAEYRAAAALDPTDARVPYQLGLTYQIEGRLPEAIEQYRIAARLDPDNPKPRQRLEAALAEPGRR